MQVALDPLQLGGGDVDRAGARLGEALDAGGERRREQPAGDVRLGDREAALGEQRQRQDRDAEGGGAERLLPGVEVIARYWASLGIAHHHAGSVMLPSTNAHSVSQIVPQTKPTMLKITR